MYFCLALLVVLGLLAAVALARSQENACPKSSVGPYRPFANWILSLGEENYCSKKEGYHGGAFTSWFAPNKLDGEWDWYPHLTGVTNHQPQKYTLRWNPALNRIQMIPRSGGRAWLARWADDHRLVIETGAGPVSAQVFQTRGCTTPRILTSIGSFTRPVYYGYAA